MVHYKLKVYGRVQGVSFRAHAKNKCQELKLNGFVRNMGYDSVYIEAEGNESDIHALVDWCHYGPPLAQVERVEMETGHVVGYSNFIIKY